MKHFNYFKVSELFSHNSDKEVLDCVTSFRFDNLLNLLVVLDSLREFVGYPIIINSAYRDSEHNKKVGGVSNSQHLLGEAIDFKFERIPFNIAKYKVREFFKKSALERFVGQVIFYNNFIHIGLRTQSHPNLFIYEKGTNKNNR